MIIHKHKIYIKTKRGEPLAKALKERMELTYNMHVDSTNNDFSLKNKCGGCSLCNTNLIVFPEGTTTNGSCLLAFRKGVFIAGLPVKPIVFRFPWTSMNSCWESTYFSGLTKRMIIQFWNKMEIIECPPYLPNKYEREDPSLYAFNVSLFMARMMEYNTNFTNVEEYGGYKLMKNRISYLQLQENNKNKSQFAKMYEKKIIEKKLHCPIYLLNRNQKTQAYHLFVVLGWSTDLIRNMAKKSWKSDKTLEKHREWIEKYQLYLEYLNSKND